MPNNNDTMNVHEGQNQAEKIKVEDVLSGFVECAICEISFCGTNATLEQHMNDVHNKEQKNEFMKEEKTSAVDNKIVPHMEQEDCSSKEFVCKYCGKSCKSYLTLDQHIRLCDKRLTQYQSLLEQHMKIFNEESKGMLKSMKNENKGHQNCRQNIDGNFLCKYCDQIFTQQCFLMKHIRFCDKSLIQNLDVKNHHKEKGLVKAIKNDDQKCQSCGKLFSRADSLKKHIFTVHEGHKNYKCESCGKLFSGAIYLKKHIHTFHEGHRDHMMVHNGKIYKYKCSKCPKTFTKASHMKRHMDTHENIRSKCDICCKDFIFKKSLDTHIKTVHEEKRDYKCDICGKSSSSIQNYKSHLKIHRSGANEEVKRLKCNVCYKTFKTRHSFNYHKKTQHNKAYNCHICEKVYQIPALLANHITTEHEGVQKPNLSCSQCNNTFVNESNLRDHIDIVHQGIKKFKCGLCNQTFGYKSHLNDHLMSHAGNKRFKCNQCEKSYFKNNHLKRHMTVAHEGIKYTCKICNKIFNHGSKLKRHIGEVHEEKKRVIKKLTCEICSKVYSDPSGLRYHVQNIHKK